MADIAQLKLAVQQITQRKWDIPAIDARYHKLLQTGIPRKTLIVKDIVKNKNSILNNVQRRGEEYEYRSHS